jgi:cobalt-zinc-cadmium efflux system outer membrane protein
MFACYPVGMHAPVSIVVRAPGPPPVGTSARHRARTAPPRRSHPRRAARWALLLAGGVIGTVGARSLSAQGLSALPDTLTLETAFRIARQYSPALERVDAQRGIAQGLNQSAGQWPNPTLEYRRENIGAPLQPDEFVTAYIPIDITGRRIQLSRATARGRDGADARGRDAQSAVELSIANAWVEASLASSVRQTRQQQVEAVQEIARLEAIRAREGASSEASALRTRVEAARLLQAVALDQDLEQRAHVALAALLGVPADRLPVIPVLTVRRVSDAGVAASMENEALVAQARQARSALRAAELARDEAALRARVARGGVLGDWQLQAGTKRTSGFMSGQFGLAVPIPAFNRNSGARFASTNTLRDAEAAYREVELQVQGEVVAAADNLRRLRALQSEMLASPELGDVIVSSARVAYAEGEMSLLELLDAHRAWTDAYLTAQQYHANLILARLRLARAIGAPVHSGAAP